MSLDEYNLIETFPSNELPNKIMAMDGMYVTQNFNFPEIDMIWKSGQTVFGVQVPISKYHNMLEKFTEVCDKVGWLTRKIKKVYLLCISAEQRIDDSVQCNIPEIQGPITVIALCISRIPL